MLNPCFCISPRIGAFAIAIVDIFLVSPYVWDVLNNIAGKTLQYDLIVELVFSLFVVFFALLLLFGVIQNSQEKVRLWLSLWLVFLVVMVLFRIFNIAYTTRMEARIRIGNSFGGLAFFAYQLWVVYAYLTELKSGPKALTYWPLRVEM